MRSDTLFFSLLVGMTTLPVQRIPRVCASAPACVGPVSLAHASIRTLSLSRSGPTTVLVLSLLFIAFVVLLHIWGKFRKG